MRDYAEPVSKILPTKFLLKNIGGAFGDAEGIELKGTIFHIFKGDKASKKSRRLPEEPNIEQWIEFRKFLDTNNVWAWKDSSDEDICIDGGYCFFEIEYLDGKAINIHTYDGCELDWSLLKAAISWLSNSNIEDEYAWDDEDN
tara:strand:+ start:2492 stop:2920 length:429 start_codon:yes stop_codon:yes gene_type:complete